jgi:hypothetical protein
VLVQRACCRVHGVWRKSSRAARSVTALARVRSANRRSGDADRAFSRGGHAA